MKIPYIPRHLRLGVNLELKPIVCFHEQLEEIPIVDSTGVKVGVTTKRVLVNADETIGKLNWQDFTFPALKEAGVPLTAFNLNVNRDRLISDIYEHCKSLDEAQTRVTEFVNKQNELEKWFSTGQKETENK